MLSKQHKNIDFILGNLLLPKHWSIRDWPQSTTYRIAEQPPLGIFIQSLIASALKVETRAVLL